LGEGVLDLAFSPDGRAFVTAGPDVVLWSASNGARVAELPLPAGVQAMSVAVSPDGRVILVGLSNGNIAIYDAASRQLLRALEGHFAPVYGVAFSPDGTAFASTAGQYDPRLWKKDVTGEYVKGERDAVGAAAAAQPAQDQAQALGFLVWLLGAVGQMHVIGAPLGAPPLGSGLEALLGTAPRKLPKFCAPRVAFSPDGRYLASSASLMENPYGSLVDPGMPVFLTDLQNGVTKTTGNLFGCAVAFTQDSRFLITRNTILAAPTFWDVETLQRVDLSTRHK
jgi:WD40 repeat protein